MGVPGRLDLRLQPNVQTRQALKQSAGCLRQTVSRQWLIIAPVQVQVDHKDLKKAEKLINE